MQEKRIKLYSDFLTDAKDNGLEKTFKKKYPSFSKWESTNFMDEDSANKLWDKAISLSPPLINFDFDTFKTKFTCDLEWASGSTACKSVLDKLKKIVVPALTSSTQTNIVREPKKEKEVEAEITPSDILNGSKTIGLKYKGDVVLSIQSKLSKLKDSNGTPFYNKSINGVFDKETQAAVIRFQRSNPYLDETGKVDQPTLKAINYELNPNKYIYERTIKKIVTEGEIKDKKKQKKYLETALENGCIPKLEGGKIGWDSSKNSAVYFGQIEDGSYDYYYGNVDDETGEITKINSKKKELEESIDCQEVLTLINYEKQKNQDQKKFIENLMKNNPGDYVETADTSQPSKYQPIDVSTISGAQDLFQKGEKIIYQVLKSDKTIVNKFSKQAQQLTTWGFTLDPESGNTQYGAPLTSYFGAENPQIKNLPEKNELVYPTNETIEGMKIDYTACTPTINKLYGAITREKGAVENINPGTLPKEKLQVYRCAQNSSVTGKLRNLKVFGLRTPPLEKLNTILNDRTMYGVNPLLKSLRQNVQTESKDRALKNIVRENLIKYKLQKKDNLVVEERKIVKQRFDIFKNNSKPSKQTQIKFFQEIIQESVILQKQGFDQKVISEGIFDIFSGLFGKQGGESVLQTFKEYIIGFIIKKLTPLDPDGWMGTAIKVSLADIDIADIPKLTNCNFLVERLAKSLPEVILAKFISEHTKDFGSLSKGALDVLRNSFSEGFSSLEFMNSIKTGLSSLICPGLSKISTKLDEKGDSLVQKAMGS